MAVADRATSEHCQRSLAHARSGSASIHSALRVSLVSTSASASISVWSLQGMSVGADRDNTVKSYAAALRDFEEVWKGLPPALLDITARERCKNT